MKKIQSYQIKKIYAIANKIGIVENGNHHDELHLLIGGMTGKDSVRSLTYQQAGLVLERLEQLQGKKSPVAGAMTSGQKKKVWALMYQLKTKDKEGCKVPLGERLCGIIKKELKVDSKAKDPFVWLDYSSGNKLIEILKNYVKNTKKQMG